MKERGWRKVRALACEHDRIACSIYGRLELHAALHRKLREGELTEQQSGIVRRQLSIDESVRIWQWIPLSATTMDAVVDTFADLSEHVYLRSCDAVHLMSAREFGCTAVYSNDRHLIVAAPHVGMTARDVIEPGAVLDTP